MKTRKDAPAVGDVHVSTTGGGRRRKPGAAASQDEKLPVTGQTAAAQAENGDDEEGEGKPAAKSWSIPFTVAKADPDQRLIFGWASVVEQDGQLVIDKQGDIILPEDLEKAAYDFVLYARKHGEMHDRIGTGQLVESMVFTREKQAALGVDLKKVGWWVGFKVNDDKTWAAHKRGELPEFSIGGSGRRVEV